jgi:hypothetical protein
MTRFTLELYYEHDGDRRVGDDAADALRRLVAELAPRVDLEVTVLEAVAIEHAVFDRHGGRRVVPYHGPARAGSQTLLITSDEIGAEGWGWPGCCVVGRQALVRKAAAGGNPADILVHEWLHTICGEVIDGRAVPFVDDAETLGFTSVPGADGEPTWHAWYRYALGGRPDAAAPAT